MHIAVSLDTVSGGAGVTVTITESVAVQPSELVAVTVYVVVANGVAVGLAVEAPVSVPFGVHAYVFPFGPEAKSTVLLPGQMLTSGLPVTSALEMVTVTLSVAVQPLASVTVSVYVVAEGGQTDTDAPLRFPGIQL